MTVRIYADGASEQRALEVWRILTARGHQFRKIPLPLLVRLQGALCYLCAQAMDLGRENRSKNLLGWTLEHVFPRAAGGGERSNVLLAHRVCNDVKGQRWPYPCEVIYLYAMYAEPYDAKAMRLARSMHQVARNNRRRYHLEQANS